MTLQQRCHSSCSFAVFMSGTTAPTHRKEDDSDHTIICPRCCCRVCGDLAKWSSSGTGVRTEPKLTKQKALGKKRMALAARPATALRPRFGCHGRRRRYTFPFRFCSFFIFFCFFCFAFSSFFSSHLLRSPVVLAFACFAVLFNFCFFFSCFFSTCLSASSACSERLLPGLCFLLLVCFAAVSRTAVFSFCSSSLSQGIAATRTQALLVSNSPKNLDPGAQCLSHPFS